DGRADILTGAGPGAGPHVEVFKGSNGALERSFYAYASNFPGGVYVAAGDVTGDGIADIITGAGPGAGPHVEVFRNNLSNSQTLVTSFYAYPETFPGGVRVGVGDTNNDGRPDLLTAPGNGAALPEASFDALSTAQLHSFFAFGATAIGAF